MMGDSKEKHVTGNEVRTDRALRASDPGYRRLFEAARESCPHHGLTNCRSTVLIMDRLCKDFRQTPEPSKIIGEQNHKSAVFGGFFPGSDRRNGVKAHHHSGIINALELGVPKSFGFCKGHASWRKGDGRGMEL